MTVIIKGKFVIRRDTMAILPEFSSGGLYSKVMEGDQTFCVDISPYNLMNYSLLHYCSDLKGAMRGTKTILGKVNIPPVRINGNPDMYWLPHKSPYQADCVWIALHHIRDLDYYSKNQTRVILTHGHSIILDISLKQLQSRITAAEQLQFKMEKNMNRTRTFLFDPEKGIQYCKDENNNYCNKDINQHF